MGKLIIRFWLVNFLVIIAFLIINRMSIIQTASTSTNWLKDIFYIIEIFLKIHFALFVAAIIVLFSFSFFLNLVKKIRQNYIWSMLSFLGLPLLLVLYFTLQFLLTDPGSEFFSISHSFSDLITYKEFYYPVSYLLILLVEFLIFRKISKRTDHLSKTPS